MITIISAVGSMLIGNQLEKIEIYNNLSGIQNYSPNRYE